MNSRTPIIFGITIVLVTIAVLAALVSVPTAVVLVVGLGVTFLVFFKPFYGLILYLFLLYISPQMFVPGLMRMRLMLILAGVMLLIFFIHRVFNKKSISIISSRHELLMLILLFLVPISLITNGYLDQVWEGFYTFLTVYLLFFLVVKLTEDFNQFRAICWTIVTFIVIMAIDGLIMAFRGYDLVGHIPSPGDRIRYLEFGHFSDPNDFALAINAVFPFILVNLFDKSINLRWRLLLIIVACIFIMAIYYTNSRGGYFALIVMLAAFAISRWGIIKGAVLGVVLLTLALVFAPSRMADVSPYGTSASGRIYAWLAGLTMLKARPVLGIGFGNFTNNFGITAHSAFIQCMSELGLIGYFVWLALMYSSYEGLRKVIRLSSGIQKKYAGIIKLSLIGVLTSSIFLSQAYSPVIYVILGLSVLSIRSAAPQVVQRRGLMPRDLAIVGGFMAASVILFKILAIVYH